MLQRFVNNLVYEYLFRNPFDNNVPGEVVLYGERQSLIGLLSRSWQAGAAMIGLVILVIVLEPSGPLGALLAAGGLICFAIIIYQVAEWAVDVVFISNKRLYEISGFLRLHIAAQPLGKLTDMTYEQSFIGKIFQYATFVSETAGQNQAIERLRYLRNPTIFYEFVTYVALDGSIDLKKAELLLATVPIDEGTKQAILRDFREREVVRPQALS